MSDSQTVKTRTQDAFDAYQDAKAINMATLKLARSLPESKEQAILLRALELAEELFMIQAQNPVGKVEIGALLPATKFNELTLMLQRVREHPEPKLMREVAQFINMWLRESIDDILVNVDKSNNNATRRELRGYLTLLSESLTASEVIQKLRRVEKEAIESRDATREATSDTGAAELSKEFEAYGKKQGHAGIFWTVAAVVGLLATAAVAYILIQERAGAVSLSDLGRLAITLPLAGAAVYAARVAGHYREGAQWAHSIAVQLKTIRAYSQVLPDEAKNSLRYELGVRAFGPLTGNREIVVPPTVASEPLALIERASVLLKAGSDAVQSTRPKDGN